MIVIMMVIATVGAFSSQDIKVTERIPKEAEVGKSVALDCEWQLAGNGTLYTVKWTKNEYEIFSYNPENEREDRVKIFPRDGFNITVGPQLDYLAQKSNKISIRLTHLTLNSSGQYRCEVSTGAPFYHTNFKQRNMTVISPPNQPPEVKGVSDYYAVGEKLIANCTSWPSVPKAKLQWIINNKTVSADHLVEYPPLKREPEGLPNILGLEIIIKPSHFSGSVGKLKVKCIAYVGSKRYETEKFAIQAHAKNQRLSSGVPISSAPYSVTLLLVTVMIAT